MKKIVYPSIYKINYEDKSKFNTMLINDKLYRDIDKTNIYHLEALNICDLDAWNRCFKIVNIKSKKHKNVNEYLKSDEFCQLSKKEKKNVLKNGQIQVDYAAFGEVCCDIQKIFSGSFNYVGENFAISPLVVGTLQNYIYQYISNCIFGLPNVYAALQNLPEINKTIESLPKKMINNLLNNDILGCIYNSFVEEICKEDQEDKKEDEQKDKQGFLFRKKNVIEFSLFYKSPNINFNSSDNLKNYLSEEIVKMNIPDSLWKVYFILN